MEKENKITASEDLFDIKARLHRAIEAISIEEIVKSGSIPQIVQRIGKDSQGNNQSVTVALYFDLRTININGNDSQGVQKCPTV